MKFFAPCTKVFIKFLRGFRIDFLDLLEIDHFVAEGKETLEVFAEVSNTGKHQFKQSLTLIQSFVLGFKVCRQTVLSHLLDGLNQCADFGARLIS
jgi:hypothetical protein